MPLAFPSVQCSCWERKGLTLGSTDFLSRIYNICKFLLEFRWVEEFLFSFFINIYGVSPKEAW